MKKYLTKKFIISILIYTMVVKIATVVFWETAVEEKLDAWFNSDPITIQRQTEIPTTIDEMLNQQAKDYLKSPEAFEWAKEQVTRETVEELSKL